MNKPMRKFRKGKVYQTSSYIKSEVTAIVSFLFGGLKNISKL